MIRYINFSKFTITEIAGMITSSAFWLYLAFLIEPENYGQIQFLLGVATMVSYVSLIGGPNSIIVYLAKKIPVQAFFIFTSLIIGLGGFGISALLLKRFDVGFLILGFIIYNLGMAILQGKQDYKNYFRYTILQRISLPITGFGFFFIFGIDAIIYGIALSYCGFIILIVKELKNNKLDFSLLKGKIGFVSGNYIITLSGIARENIDKLIVVPILGYTVLGNYSLSLQAITVMGIFIVILNRYGLPLQASGSNIKRINNLMMLLSIPLTAIGFFILPVVIDAVIPKYHYAIDGIKILSFVIFPMTLVKIYISKFLSLEKTKYVISSSLIFLCLQIPLMIFLGLMYGIIGISFSYLVSVIGQAGFLYAIDQKYASKKGDE